MLRISEVYKGRQAALCATRTPTVYSCKRLIRCCALGWCLCGLATNTCAGDKSLWCTSKTPSSMVRMETSKVPPPRSKTRMWCSPPRLSRPYAMAAAVGSLMMRSTVRPAMVPASFVACAHAWRTSRQLFCACASTAVQCVELLLVI